MLEANEKGNLQIGRYSTLSGGRGHQGKKKKNLRNPKNLGGG